MEIVYSFITAEEFLPYFKTKRDKLFSNDYDFNVEQILSLEEKEKRISNGERLKNAHRYYLVAKSKNRIIGWSFGIQKGADEYYMINSAVLPDYRNHGIYTCML